MYRKTEKLDGAVTLMMSKEEFAFLRACFEVGYEGWDSLGWIETTEEVAMGVNLAMGDA